MWTAFRRLSARLRAHLGGSDMDREFAEELESHLEMLAADNVRRGMAPDEAARRARLTLGSAGSRVTTRGRARERPGLFAFWSGAFRRCAPGSVE